MAGFKLIHEGDEAPEQVTVGVQVREDCPRDTLEVPVSYSWDDKRQNRVYTFIKFTRTRRGKTVVETRSTRFVECPKAVAELMASVEFQEPDPLAVGGVQRGKWLDVRYATNQAEFDKAESLPPSDTLKAETAPEPVNLLRKQSVTRVGTAMAPSSGETDELDTLTKAQLEERLVAMAGSKPTKATKAELIALIRSAPLRESAEG
jgi:hypothetical protein